VAPGLRKTLGALMALVGGAGFFSGFIFSSGTDQHALRSFEFPLSDVQSMVVDSQGRIFVALAFYGRIQRYDSQGRFQRGWAAQSEGGPFALGLRGKDTIVTEVGRRQAQLLFDPDGRLLAERPNPRQQSLPTGDPVTAIGPDGSLLELRHGLFSSSIVHDSAGVVTALIKGPLLLRYLGGFQAWLIFALGMIIYWGGLPHWKQRQALNL
jgi:hypothetical protein